MSVAEDQMAFSDGDVFEDREPFAAFVVDEDGYGAVTNFAKQRGWPTGEVQRGGLSAALRQLGVVAAPELMVVDLSDVDDPAAAMDGLNELTGGSRVIALGTQNDVGMFRRVLDAGAADYLVKPVTAESLDEAVRRAEEAAASGGTAPARRGRCVAVVGARGGVGASTLAGNLAWLIASERERRVGLIDLDLQYGNQALAYDVAPGAGLREAIEDPERVDEMFLDHTGVKIGERLSIFAAEEAVDDGPQIPGGSLAQILAKIREARDVVVVDLPRGLLGQHPDVLEQVTDLVVVSDLSLPGLRDCNRLVRLAKPHGGKLRVRIVANRVGKQAPGQVEAAEFAKELETELSAQLCFDPDAVAKSAMAGKPLPQAHPKSKLLKDLRAFVTELVGEPRKVRKPLFSFRKKA